MRQTKVKICGLTQKDQAREIAELGVDAIGYIFYPPSPRYVKPENVALINRELPPFTTKVGVFVDEDISVIQDVYQGCGLSLVQLSGDESPEYCEKLSEFSISWMKGIRVKNSGSLSALQRYKTNYFLLDAWSATEHGGTGKQFDWSALRDLREGTKIILAGGINAANAVEAIRTVKPYALDLSSSVENSPGDKSIDIVKKLLNEIDTYEMELRSS